MGFPEKEPSQPCSAKDYTRKATVAHRLTTMYVALQPPEHQLGNTIAGMARSIHEEQANREPASEILHKIAQATIKGREVLPS